MANPLAMSPSSSIALDWLGARHADERGTGHAADRENDISPECQGVLASARTWILMLKRSKHSPCGQQEERPVCDRHATAAPQEGHDLTTEGPLLSRRGVLTGAAALAGAGALLGANPPATAASTAHRASGTPEGGTVAPPLTLTGATLLDPETGEVTENATLVLEGGRVARAGRGERPGQGEVIDVGGAFVLPGFIDGHVHVDTVEDAQRALAAGATTIRSAGTRNYQDVALRRVQELGRVRVPRVVAAGLHVRPNIGDGVLADPELARFAGLPDGVQSHEDLAHWVNVNLDQGVDVIKTSGTERAGLPEQDPRVQVLTTDQIRVIVETARDRGASTMAHAHGDEGGRAAVEAGVASIEHGTWLSEQTLDLMVEQGTYLSPTFSAVVDLARPGGEYTDRRLVARGREMFPQLLRTVRAAHAKGIPIVASTDTSWSEDTLSSMAGEMGFLVQAGLSPLDAIRGATTVAARLLQQERFLGRLQPGSAADAVVIDGDPLADIAALTRIRHVIAAGWLAASHGRLRQG